MTRQQQEENARALAARVANHQRHNDRVERCHSSGQRWSDLPPAAMHEPEPPRGPRAPEERPLTLLKVMALEEAVIGDRLLLGRLELRGHEDFELRQVFELAKKAILDRGGR
jgi:hypothetical protein